MPELRGGCLCGAVRYSTTAEPVTSGVCHCRDCQKFTGSAFGALLYVPKETLMSRARRKPLRAPAAAGSRCCDILARNAAHR